LTFYEFIKHGGVGTKVRRRIFIWFLILQASAVPALVCGETPSQVPGSQLSVVSPGLDEILHRVEERYAVSGFTARFFQTSILKAMQITDAAKGRIFIKHPGKMRWEYDEPEPQVIISDGYQLWIYRPDDRQVMIGKAPDFFGDGKGAGFLTDIRTLRKNFEISLDNSQASDDHHLILVPRNQNMDVTQIFLTVSWTTFDIVEIVTLNAYGDETRIVLDDADFDRQIADDLFRFVIPEGIEVLKMD
jgi:outer membrane lipoprotein carrier protein